MLEAVILSVTPSYLVSLKKNKPNLYARVQHLKSDIEKPLASILTFNTVAHTLGATGAGAQAQKLSGSEVLAVFSAVLTFAILFFSEIIPKSIGASRWRTLLPIAARVLKPMMILSYPLVVLSEKLSSMFKNTRQSISKDEIEAMADIGLSDGALRSSEHRALKGLIKFEVVKAKEILTPTNKVKSININSSVQDAYKSIQEHTFSRIIVMDENRTDVKGYVLRTKLQDAYINQSKEPIRHLTLPLLTLPESISLPNLFQRLLERREHICAIVDNQRKFLGVIALEDLIEHMLDLEIFDEQDQLVP